MKKQISKFCFIFLLFFSSTACSSWIQTIGIKLFYRKANLAESQIIKDISYKTGAQADPIKHKLDLYLPDGKNWPVLVFVHGGGWTEGDKSLTIAGDDIYGNIGRFFAAHGVGVVLVNYRLMPNVNWKEQVADVSAAVDWVDKNISQYGGNPHAVFLSGHSAGGQLVSRVGLQKNVCGVISVSGAGLDLTDQETYKLGADINYYRKRFQLHIADADAAWQNEASPIRLINSHSPPFLIFYTTGESKALQRQSQLLHSVLDQNKIANQIIVIPHATHELMVLLMSREGKGVAEPILQFIRETACSD